MSNRIQTSHSFEGDLKFQNVRKPTEVLFYEKKDGIEWNFRRRPSDMSCHAFYLDTQCIKELSFFKNSSKAKVRLESSTKPALSVEVDEKVAFTRSYQAVDFEFNPRKKFRNISMEDWETLDTVKFELTMDLTKGVSNILPPWDLEDPAVIHDRVLIVEDTRIHVISDILSRSSTYFRDLFDSNTEKNEFPIDNTSSQDFIQMLSYIYPNDPNDCHINHSYSLICCARNFRVHLLIAKIFETAPPPSESRYWSNFEDPQTSYDKVLLVEGRRIYVQSGILSAWSYFFRAMFTSDFKEREMKEIVLDELSADEFIELLRVIYPGRHPVNADSAPFLLPLADRFDMPAVLCKCSRFLCQAPPLPFTLPEVLDMVFAYNLAAVKNRCSEMAKQRKLDHFKPSVVGELCQVPEAEKFRRQFLARWR